MSSSEEYLDNLLKNLLAGEGKVETEPKKKEQDSPEALFASIGDASQERIDSEDSHVQDDRLDQVPVTEFNKALSTDAIEEMLASMGTSPVAENLMPEEENLQEESEDWESFDLKEWSPEEEILSVDSEEEESLALEEWDVEEDCLPEVADEPEEAVIIEDKPKKRGRKKQIEAPAPLDATA